MAEDGGVVVDHEDPECHGAYCTDRMTEHATHDRAIAETIAWHSSPIYVVWDVDGTVRSASESYAAHFGLQVAELIGRRWPDLVPEESALAWQQLRFSLAALEREPIAVMDMPENSTGPTRWYRWTEWAIHDDAGCIVQVRSTAVEVTELHEARAALASVIDAVVAARTEGRREVVEQLHQGAVQHLVAARWALDHGETPEAAALVDDALAAVRSSMDMLDAPIPREVTVTADHPFWQQMSDASRRDDLPEQLRASVLDVLGSAVAVVASTGAIWLAPNARGTLWDEGVDVDLAALLSATHPDDRAAVAAALVDAVDGTETRVHWRFRHAIQGWRSLSTWLAPLPLLPNEPRFAVAFTLDITPDLDGPATDVASVQLAERARIARELHDDALQRLAGLRWLLGGREVDDEVIAELDATEDAIRSQLHRLHSSVERFGLRLGLEQLVDVTATPVTLQLPDDVDAVPAELAETLWQTAREALRNVDAHARASSVVVAVQVDADVVAIAITDDGVGVDTTRMVTARMEGHLGMASMREAAVRLGGRLELTTPSGGGTQVRVELPRR